MWDFNIEFEVEMLFEVLLFVFEKVNFNEERFLFFCWEEFRNFV